jgi:multidrug efflux pump subunit AcrA (membrane-fusion protein)
MPTNRLRILLGLTVVMTLPACGKEAPKPPEKLTPITVAVVKTKDLPITETSVGAETAVGLAQEFDPARDIARRYYIRLPFPRAIAHQIKIGQTITLTNFGDGKSARGTIRQILPALNTLTQSVEVIAEVPPTGTWRPEGSVRGEVTLGVRRHALVVPEQAVVLRPAGGVVYVPEGDSVKERVVKQGTRREGEIEILEGLQAGDIVVVDGAGMLSPGAKVKVREAAATAAETKAP